MQTTIQLYKPSLATSQVTVRKWKDTEKDAFLQDLKNAVEKFHSVDSAEDIPREYNTTLQHIADSHAPPKNRITKTRPQAESLMSRIKVQEAPWNVRKYRKSNKDFAC